jgi:1-acyl-sn-glycerol-3-phosphate acyltransferase
MSKQWKKIKLWFKFAFLLPTAYISAIRVRKKDFGLRFEVARIWAFTVLRMTNTKLKVEGLENLPKQGGHLLVGNHQGSLDAFVMFGALDIPFTAVGKIQGKKIPVLGKWYTVMDMIYFERDSVKDSLRMVKEAAEYLTKGRNILIFPEGTRSKSAELGEFKAGALKPAYIAQKPIIPIALIDAYKVLDAPGGHRFTVTVKIGKAIPFEEFGSLNTQETMTIVKEKISQMMAKKEG